PGFGGIPRILRILRKGLQGLLQQRERSSERKRKWKRSPRPPRLIRGTTGILLADSEDTALKPSIDSRSLVTLLFVLVMMTALSAQQRPSADTGMSNTGGGFISGAAGPVGAGDLLEMSVFDTPELSGKLRVSNTGDVILPLVGSLHVAGLSASETQGLI